MSGDAASLHCPNCGAPAAPGDPSCKYCHAMLATVSCPSCFALMFDGAVYCPSCGARRARAAGAPVTVPCPACRGVMHEVQLGDVALLECDRCHGTWVDAQTFEHICANHEAQAAVLHQWSQSERPAAGEIHYRRCVACGKMMNRINFGRLSGTVVDVCRGHGTFLDRGELHQIVAFIQQGGLDRARQVQLQDLKDEEERLRAMQTQTQRQSGSLGGGGINIDFETHTWSGPDVLSLLDHLTKLK